MLWAVWKSVCFECGGLLVVFDAGGQEAPTLPYTQGGVPPQLLLIRKSICVSRQIVYVVLVQVGVCGGEWVGLLVIHLSQFPPQCNMMMGRDRGGPAYLYCFP